MTPTALIRWFYERITLLQTMAFLTLFDKRNRCTGFAQPDSDVAS